MKKQIAWIFGGAAIIGLGMMSSLSACSGDDTKTDGGPQKDATADNSSPDTGPGTDSGPGTDGGTDSSTADCGSIPSLHPSDAGSIFCGYPSDGGGAITCTTGNQCCLGGEVGTTFQDNNCATLGATCNNPPPDSGTSNAVPIECEQNSDCTANGKSGDVCCLQGGKGPNAVPGCGYSKATNGTAIACETPSNGACTGTNDIQICSSNTDCPNGKTCQAGKWKIFQIGFCM